jgi:16S rRNA (adenine1518-N6/adenine1519-N6)-dimethyltransferase
MHLHSAASRTLPAACFSMAQTKQQIQAALAAAGTQPRHRFGQNFMIDGNLVRAIADAAAITAEDTVIEVGPGTGTLTEELLARAGRVIAVEIDRDLAESLRTTFADNPKFTLIEGDALQTKHQLNAELLQLMGKTVSSSENPDATARAVDRSVSAERLTP